VGIFPGADYEEHELNLRSGDRLLIYSDGVTECENSTKQRYSIDRLVDMMRLNRKKPLNELIKSIHDTIYEWNGGSDFEDDISVLALEVK
jgi:sigma-B regulation protein RsbU (phosphoserine phosphatase)